MGDSTWCTAPDGTGPNDPIPYDLTDCGRALADRLRDAGLDLDEADERARGLRLRP